MHINFGLHSLPFRKVFKFISLVFVLGLGLTKSIISITVDRDVLRWIRAKVEEGVFANRSHAFGYSVRQLMKKEKKRGTSQTPS